VTRPKTLYHATPTRNVEKILREGLVPSESFCWEGDPNDKVINLSTDDESSLVGFFGDVNGCVEWRQSDRTNVAVDTITLLEVNVVAIPLEWPGQDGETHYVARRAIPPHRIRVVSTCTLEQVARWHEGSTNSADVDEVIAQMTGRRLPSDLSS